MWNLIRSISFRLVSSFKTSLPVIMLATFILINVTIWWAGPWLDIYGQQPLATVISRVILSIIFSLCCFTVWGVMQWRSLQRINKDKAREDRLLEDPIKRLEERQQVELNQIMGELKQNLNKRNYLYCLPWYLVLGLENAGKTSLINRSSQNFAFSSVMRASGKKSENPYSFDWWIGDDAVLIDPDGELLTQRQNEESNDGELERRLWLNFVNWLEKTRSQRPLNGVVIALDIEHLASSTVAERRAYANLLRARLRELMEILSTRMPVYIALTKLDLLHGFEPYFRSYTQSQREEVMGFTFSLDTVKDFDHWLAEFDHDYTQFIERINDSLPLALRHAVDTEDRTAIYSFSRQVAGLHDVLKQLLKDAFACDQFSTPALIRGIYFMSVYQQGVPTNAFVDAASRRYGLSNTINSAQHSKNSTTFFVKRLFNEIIYPEAGIASDSLRVIRHKTKVLSMSVLACSIASVLLIGGWQRYYSLNIAHENAVLDQVNQFKEEYSNAKLMRSEQELLAPLNSIRQATLEFGVFQDQPKYVSDMGLYQGHKIGPKVEETYLGLLQFRFLPALMKQLAADIKNANSEQQELSALRVFRMLTDRSGRQDDVVRRYFEQVWQQAFPNDAKTQEQLLAHLNYSLAYTNLQGLRNHGNKNAISIMSPYDNLIEDTQQDLSSLDLADRVYDNLKRTAEQTLGAPLNIKKAVGPVFEVVFGQRIQDGALNIPQLLTIKGFNNYFLPKIESLSDIALADSWVLGESTVAKFSAEDKQVLRQKIRNLYVDDYVNTWQLALNNIEIKYFSDINEAIIVLGNIVGHKQPIERFIKTVDTNTQLFPKLPENDKARLALMTSPQYKVASMIATPFTDIDSILDDNGNQPAYLQEVMALVQQLYHYMKAIQDAPDKGKAALEATKNRLALKGNDPISALQQIATNLPKPLDSLVKEIAEESWYVVKQEAIKYVEVRWQRDVYKEYQEKLISRYPFNSSASKDVSLKDFETFFAPDGTLESFYNNDLKLFIDDNISMGTNSSNALSLLRSDVLKQFANAEKIQQAFFNRKGILDVEFTLEPINLSANQRRSVINVDGQYVEYSHGSRRPIELIWPNTLRETAVSKLSLVPASKNLSPRAITIQGPWAFFRLLERGQVVGASETSVDYRFTIDGGDVVYRLNTEEDANPFTSSLFRNFKLSKTLY
ncbi:type VI secretion protein IcmF [Photobacterium kishitanii]|uniref:Type VI secretion system membrane subunit TssM n=1 Tax=Photobacterium kishitanii TaxID=318456 RepID=A0AAX0YQG2_9GAMM|nr:type VI secretion system membrane subunit TssM [Photobacterium kishitanii]KJG59621.1 type VI secretion protein IcmF [Photobacterium kishitanii]KJG62913.1 type VI secretion protein IcmF [Photobacterium kishitanii]KJG71087.1 type VI secretion protein IcmF [Photobacterium kishitanii]PSX16953.1 type VI secretion system membrane subunit TssM [Photobacterium kishitanii]PSX29387.1 type VI secretion system membrane subunit TssM [Photobacterium kishitanii]